MSTLAGVCRLMHGSLCETKPTRFYFLARSCSMFAFAPLCICSSLCVCLRVGEHTPGCCCAQRGLWRSLCEEWTERKGPWCIMFQQLTWGNDSLMNSARLLQQILFINAMPEAEILTYNIGKHSFNQTRYAVKSNFLVAHSEENIAAALLFSPSSTDHTLTS